MRPENMQRFRKAAIEIVRFADKHCGELGLTEDEYREVLRDLKVAITEELRTKRADEVEA